MEPLIAAFEKLFKTHLKTAAKQDKSMNIVRAVIRLCYSIKNAPELAEDPDARFNDFIEQ